MYDIQSVNIISSSNGTVCIQCNYITGADSTGCIVSLSNTNITVYNITISYNNEYGCVEVIAGFYSMYIFEVNNDGTIVEVENIVTDIIIVESSILSTTSYVTNSIIPTMPSKFMYIIIINHN